MERGAYLEAARSLRRLHPSLGSGILTYFDSDLDLDPVRLRLAYCLAMLGERAELEQLFAAWDPARGLGEARGQRFAEAMRALADGARPVQQSSNDWPYIYGGAGHLNIATLEQRIGSPRMWLRPASDPRQKLFTGQFQRMWTVYEPRMPGSMVAIAGDRVYAIDQREVVALSLVGGSLLWQAPIDNNVETSGGRGPNMPSEQSLRNWRSRADPTSNSLSLSGKWLFTIQRCAPPGYIRWRPQWQAMNILRVYDTTQQISKVQQTLTFGGPDEQREHFKNTYWLAAPVALDGNVFIPVQQENTYRIFCLDGETLALRWRTDIAAVTDSVSQNWYDIGQHAAAGSSVAAGGGKIYWISHNGAVACLDAHDGQKIWVARYWNQTYPDPSNPRAQPNKPPKSLVHKSPAAELWHMSPPVLAAGRLICAPRDGHLLVCYDASTGEVLWRQPQADARGIAGVSGNEVFLYGPTLRVVDLIQGRLLRVSKPQAFGELTGRPVLTRRELYLPTASGLAIIDQKTLGLIELLDMTALHPGGEKPLALGNLTVAGAVLISSHWQGLTAFYAQDLKQRLIETASAAIAQNPNDPTVHRERCEQYAEFGLYSEAFNDALTAYQLATTASNRREQRRAQRLVTQLGQQLHRQTGAIDPLEKALGVVTAPAERLPLLFKLGRSHQQHQHWDEAAKIFNDLQRSYEAQEIVLLSDQHRLQLGPAIATALAEIKQHRAQNPATVNELVAAVRKAADIATIAALPEAQANHPAALELRYLHAREIESSQGAPAAAQLYHQLATRGAGTSAALGALGRLALYYRDNELPRRASVILVRIERDYSTTPWPAESLTAWLARYAPSDEQPGVPGAGQGDGDRQGAPGDEPVPTDGKQFAERLRATLPQPPVTASALQPVAVLPAGWPMQIDKDASLTTADDLSYEGAEVLAVYPDANCYLLWHRTSSGVNTLECRALNGVSGSKPAETIKANELLWRSRCKDPGTASTQRFSPYLQRAQLLREIPRPTLHRMGSLVVLAWRTQLMAVHLEWGMLKWDTTSDTIAAELRIPNEQPHEFVAFDQNRGLLQPTPAPRIVATEDRLFLLCPGGTLIAYRVAEPDPRDPRAHGLSLAWRTRIDKLRQGQLFVSNDVVVVAAEVGDQANQYRLLCFDEISGKAIAAHSLGGDLIGIPSALGPGDLIHVATAQEVKAIDVISGQLRWARSVESAEIKTLHLLGDRLLVNLSGRAVIVEASDGTECYELALADDGEYVLSATRHGDTVFLLGTAELIRETHQTDLVVTCFEYATGRRHWQQNIRGSYYVLYNHLLPLDDQACVVCTYSVQTANHQALLLQGPQQRAFSLRDSKEQGRAQNLDAIFMRLPFAAAGRLFMPVTQGIEIYGPRPAQAPQEEK
jgi:outer membrane protein assembly factor BamB